MFILKWSGFIPVWLFCTLSLALVGSRPYSTEAFESLPDAVSEPWNIPASRTIVVDDQGCGILLQ